jgi:SAM-dependent methyltransferase
MVPLDYNEIAPEFDRRYALYDYPGIRKSLVELVSAHERARVLEVGCGTGKWLSLFASAGCEIAGIEPSTQMLALARARVNGDLRAGAAEALPWPDAWFDCVVYINALHHFADPLRALQESFRVLRPGGRLLSVGLDPHQRTGRWYVYEYFPAALAADLARFPSHDQRTSWLRNAGFDEIMVRVIEHLQFTLPYGQAIQDGILERSFTSQLGVLSAEQYAAGIQRIRESAQANEAFRLEVDLHLYSTVARKPV